MAKHDVIVIGSGIGGLTAALTCAQEGLDVLVLEADKQFGGFINPFKRGKFSFDTGIHYLGELGPGQSLHRRFEKLGLLDSVEIRELDPDGFDRYVFPDYEVSMCKGADRFRDRLIRDFPAEASGIRGFFRLLAEVDALGNALTRVSGPRSVVRLLRHTPLIAKLHNRTFARVLDDFTHDVRLRGALSGPGGDIGLPPGRASGFIMMAVLIHFLGGAYFPLGGCRPLRDAYVDGLKRRGATLKRNAPVTRIEVDQGRVRAVITAKGDRYEAPLVISNAAASHTLGKMVGEEVLPRRLRRKVRSLRYSLGSLCAFVGTDLQPQEHGLTDANIWHYPSYDIDALYQTAFDGRVDGELPYFMTIPTLKDGTGSHHAPPGKHTVELITFAPWSAFSRWKDQPVLRRDREYKALKAELGDRLLAQAERYLPGLRDHAEVVEVATPLTNHAFVHTPGGSIYGLDHTPDQVGLGRFRSTTPIDGLMLCGADVLGAGIATCVTSGHLAGRIAVKKHAKRLRSTGPGITSVARRVLAATSGRRVRPAGSA